MPADAAAARLLAWLRASGGLVDAALTVGFTPTGRRGLVASSHIEASPRPLVAVPAPLILSPSTAAAALTHFHGASGGLGSALASLDPTAPLAVLLALEATQQGTALPPARPSPWGLYALSLSPAPPAGWAAPPDEMDALLAATGVPPAQWPAWSSAASASLAAAQGLAGKAAALVDRDRQRRARGAAAATSSTPTLPPLRAPSIAWALAHVVSRAFRMPAMSLHGGGIEPVLLPVIDLANHASGSADPALAEAPGALHRFATLRAAAAGGARAAVAVHAGEELTTSYSAGNGSPLEWFLNYGFVPGEARGCGR